MKSLMKPLLLVMGVALLAALGTTPLMAQTVLDDPQLDIGNPLTCPVATSCPFIFGGTEVFSVPGTGVTIYNNASAGGPMTSPVLLIVGIPNPTGSTVPPSGIIVGAGTTSGLTGLTGQLGGANVYGGSWNTTTGAVTGNPFTSGFVHSLIGLNGSNSEQIGSGKNWNNADSTVNGITVNNWDLFVYSITFTSGLFNKGTYITIDFTGGTLPVGTFVIASGCTDFTTSQCPNGNSLGSTPFTTSGLVTGGGSPPPVPEPASMLLMGSGLLGLGGMLRRRKKVNA